MSQVSQQKSGRRWILKHIMFILGGFTIGLGFSSAFMPDDPNIVAALGTAMVGLLALLVAQWTGGSCGRTEQDA